MNNNPCCCGNGNPPCIVSTDPNDYPACVQIDISGVQALAGCLAPNVSSTKIAFSGVNRSVIATQSGAGHYVATVGCYVSYKNQSSAGSWFFIYTSMFVDVQLACSNGRYIISRTGAVLNGRRTDQAGPEIFIANEYEDITTPFQIELGEPAPNLVSASCSGFAPMERVIGGGDIVVTLPGSCTPLSYLVEANECNGSGTIVVDLNDNPDDQPTPLLPVLSAITYVPTETEVSGPKTAGVAWLEVQCSQPSNLLARKCSDSSVTIAFDPALQTPGGVTLVYLGESYLPTNEPTNLPDAGGVWSTSPCPGAAKIARMCDNNAQEISYDPALQPAGALTMVWNSDRYYPTTIDSNQPPVPVVWSTLGCFSDRPFINPCFDLSCQPGSPNFPLCCSLSIYAQCVQCAGQLMFNGNQPSQRRRKAVGLGKIKTKKINPLKRRGMISEAELDAMGHSPEQVKTELNQGGCCDPPRPLN